MQQLDFARWSHSPRRKEPPPTQHLDLRISKEVRRELIQLMARAILAVLGNDAEAGDER